jgi:two-component system, cell cycle sensor histidine kinase and response regulator CckA
MNSDPVRVLLVEDDLEDVLLTRELFARVASIKVQLDHVTSYKAALEAMARQEHDIYLLDYQLGGHTGLELLREAHDRGWYTPAILLTGQGDHQIDLEATHSGAADYLAKGQVRVDLLERSLRYTLAQARAEKELRASERRLRAVYESTRDALVVFESEGQYCVEANPAACDLLGLPRAQLIGRKLSGDAPPRLLYPPVWHKVLSDGRVKGELRFERTHGSYRDIEFLVTANFLPGYDLSVLRDMTESKRLKEQYDSVENLADAGRLAATVALDLNGLVEKLACINATLIAETPSGRPHELRQQANETLERMRHLLKQLATISGQTPGPAGLAAVPGDRAPQAAAPVG